MRLITPLEKLEFSGDRGQRVVPDGQALDHGFERAAIALVGELGIEPVESDVILPRLVRFAVNELESGLIVDESPYQPGWWEPLCHEIPYQPLH